MKLDPYKTKEKYQAWKEKARNGLPDLGKENSEILLKYLQDMEIGINVANSTRKGSRSFIHLNSLKDRMLSILRKTRDLYQVNKITEITEDQIHLLFSDMANGTITKANGEKYKAVVDFVKIFKAFWHWYQKVERKKGIEIPDITQDLDTRQEKPDWVYLTEEEVKKLTDNAKYEYKVLIWFLFDTGIRAPTELMNIKVSDFYNDFKELQIRDEISKTFGRKIKLMICSKLIKSYIKEKELSTNDFVFTKEPSGVNKYLKRLSERIFGDKVSPAGQKYSELTMYDFRHISCCYWLPRYKSESALKYRFGWKGSDKIHYYSELLGMKDTISQEDMLVDVTKTDLERELELTKKRNELLEDKMATMEMQIARIDQLTDQLSFQVQSKPANTVGGINGQK